MGMGRAQDRGMQRAGLGPQIIDELTASAQQRGVFDALDGLSCPFNGFLPQLLLLPMATLLALASEPGSCIKRGDGSIPPSLAPYRLVSKSKRTD